MNNKKLMFQKQKNLFPSENIAYKNFPILLGIIIKHKKTNWVYRKVLK